MRYGNFHHDHGWGVLHWLGWLLPLVLIAGLVALAVVLLVRSGDHRTGALRPAVADDGALAALRLRYARGEINRDEYYEALRDLSQPAAPWTSPSPPTPPPAPPTAPPDA